MIYFIWLKRNQPTNNDIWNWIWNCYRTDNIIYLVSWSSVWSTWPFIRHLCQIVCRKMVSLRQFYKSSNFSARISCRVSILVDRSVWEEKALMPLWTFWNAICPKHAQISFQVQNDKFHRRPRFRFVCFRKWIETKSRNA